VWAAAASGHGHHPHLAPLAQERRVKGPGWELALVGVRAEAGASAQTSIEGGAHGVRNTWLGPLRTRSWGSGGHGGHSSAALEVRSQTERIRKLGR
jgi:hypothetical protein